MHVSKGKLKFSQKELWNGDLSLGKVIVSFLEQFKKMPKHSVPPNLDPKGSYTEDECDVAWEELIDKMIFGFKDHPTFCEISPPDFYWHSLTEPEKFEGEDETTIHPVYGELRTLRTRLKEGYTQEDVERWHADYREYQDAIDAKVKEGRELFIQYFDNLWD